MSLFNECEILSLYKYLFVLYLFFLLYIFFFHSHSKCYQHSKVKQLWLIIFEDFVLQIFSNNTINNYKDTINF